MADELSPYVIERLEGLECREDIGSGSYGVVCEVRVNGLPCIAKKLHDILTNEEHVSQQEKKAISERFRNECILLSRLRHPNIVQFLGVHYGRDRYDLTLVMERMHSDLEITLKKFPSISLPSKLRILLDASYGLLHLHCQTPAIVHRDFTAANILLSPDMRAKVADLGVSKILDLNPHQLSNHTQCPGTQYYMPPEALQQRPVYDVKLDVFSFGQLALYTINQQFPEVHELGPMQVIGAARRGNVQLTKRAVAVDLMGKDHCLHQLVTSCLQDSPKKRPTTLQVNSTLQDLAAHHPVKDQHATATTFDEHQAMSREVKVLRDQMKRLGQVCSDLANANFKNQQLKQENDVLKRINTELQSQVDLANAQAAMFEEDFQNERKDREESAIRYEAQREGLSRKVEEVHHKIQVANEELERYKELVESLEVVKEKSEVNLQQAHEEIQVKSSQVKQYKKQVDSLKEQMVEREAQSTSLIQEFERVRDELVKSKCKKSKKSSTSKEPTPSPAHSPVTRKSISPGTVPEEIYRIMESEYDLTLQEKIFLQNELDDLKQVYAEYHAELGKTKEQLQQSQQDSQDLQKQLQLATKAMQDLQLQSHSQASSRDLEFWNVPRTDIHIVSEIGRGGWGTVFKGTFQG